MLPLIAALFLPFALLGYGETRKPLTQEDIDARFSPEFQNFCRKHGWRVTDFWHAAERLRGKDHFTAIPTTEMLHIWDRVPVLRQSGWPDRPLADAGIAYVQVSYVPSTAHSHVGDHPCTIYGFTTASDKAVFDAIVQDGRAQTHAVHHTEMLARGFEYHPPTTPGGMGLYARCPKVNDAEK